MKQFSKVSFLYQSHWVRTANPVEKLELPNNPSDGKQVIRFFEYFDWRQCLWVGRRGRRIVEGRGGQKVKTLLHLDRTPPSMRKTAKWIGGVYR